MSQISPGESPSQSLREALRKMDAACVDAARSARRSSDPRADELVAISIRVGRLFEEV